MAPCGTAFGTFQSCSSKREIRLAPPFALHSLDTTLHALIADHPGETGAMLLDDNLDAFAARALSTRAATRTLDLQYYMWHPDMTGRLLGREVLKAAARGVRVRLLIDDIKLHGLDDTMLALDRHPGIEVRIFNPGRVRKHAIGRAIEMLLRAVRMNCRMHNKLWLADDTVAILGGRNIGDEYFDASEVANFHDADVLVVGAVIAECRLAFERYWHSPLAVRIADLHPGQHTEPDAPDDVFDALADLPDAHPYLKRVEADESVRAMVTGERPLHWTPHARLAVDPPDKRDRALTNAWIVHDVARAIESATRDVFIISPYFVPGDRGVAQLAALTARGVKVTVLTNSLAATDVAAVHSGYARYREALLRAGIALFELRPDAKTRLRLFGSSTASLHTKAFTVDDRIAFVGSFNFDPRSVSLNSEMGLFFEHPALLASLRARGMAQTGPGNSFRVTLDQGRLRWQSDASAGGRVWCREPEASIGRRLLAACLRYLPITSQL